MKRMLSLFLSFVFIFSSITSAYASQGLTYSEDLALLSSIGIDTSNIESITHDGEKSVYGLNYLSNNETAYITMSTDINGNTLINIVEGDLSDTLIIDHSGKIYYKGVEIGSQATNTIHPQATYASAFFDSSTPPRGVTSGYSTKLNTFNGNIYLEDKITQITVGVLGVYIRNVCGIPGSYIVAVATPIALDIKSRAGYLAADLDLDSVHYTRTVWRNDSLTNTLEKFYKHICVFTIKDDSSSVYRHYYELQQLV